MKDDSTETKIKHTATQDVLNLAHAGQECACCTRKELTIEALADFLKRGDWQEAPEYAKLHLKQLRLAHEMSKATDFRLP